MGASTVKHKTYITFGQDHTHRVNNQTFDKNCVAVIESDNAVTGRAKAFELFGHEWSMEYPEKYWDDKSLEWFPRGCIKAN
jgi:hypothetical protein